MISVVRSQVLGVLCLVMLAATPAGWAQTVSGTILGSVTDPSGAVISSAGHPHQRGTGLTRTVTTDTNGDASRHRSRPATTRSCRKSRDSRR